MFKEGNNYAFIDSQNVNLAIRGQGWKLDWQKFRVYLREKYCVTKAFLFIGYIPKYRSLYQQLRAAGYILIFKPTLISHDDIIKGNVDAELVLHTMIQYSYYHMALIVTGDGDFYCLVHYLNKQNKLLKLLVPNVHKYSGLLKRVAMDKLDFMNKLEVKLGKQKTP